MKLVTFRTADGRVAPGVLQDDLSAVVDVSDRFADMLAVIDAGKAGLAAARDALRQPVRTHNLDAVSLLAPVPEPRQVRDCMVFELEIQALGRLCNTIVQA